jgi:hypothetical protein
MSAGTRHSSPVTHHFVIGSFPSILVPNKYKVNAIPMKITRQITADKIADYLHRKLRQTELVDWAERAMMDAELVEADTEVLSDIIGRLGLARACPERSRMGRRHNAATGVAGLSNSDCAGRTAKSFCDDLATTPR